MSALQPFLYLLLISGLVLTLVAWQSAPSERRMAISWGIAGMLACAAKIALFHQTSQWLDTPLDALKYQANAAALYLHWMGLGVDPVRYDLAGYLNGWQETLGPLWLPHARVSYAGVLGTYEWLYAAYVASWHFVTTDWVTWAIWSQAALAGLFPAGAFLLSRSLGATPASARAVALLLVIDPLTGLNASWLLKDTLVAFLAVLALVTALRIESRHWGRALLLAVTLGLLGGGRFVAYLAISAGIGLLCLALLRRQQARQAAPLLAALCLSIPALLTLHILPVRPDPAVASSSLVQRIGAPAHTLSARRGEDGSDQVVIQWRSRLVEDPVRAVATSIGHTLFAPYPWVMLTDGLSGSNYVELYYPGTALWIALLPLVALGIAAAVRSPSPQRAAVLLALGSIFLAYTIFLGEWSTRQRVFMVPVVFALAALGIDMLREKSQSIWATAVRVILDIEKRRA